VYVPLDVKVCTTTFVKPEDAAHIGNADAPWLTKTCPVVPADATDCNAPVDVVPPTTGAYATNELAWVPPFVTSIGIDVFIALFVINVLKIK
jgi:hypothetical protein